MVEQMPDDHTPEQIEQLARSLAMSSASTRTTQAESDCRWITSCGPWDSAYVMCITFDSLGRR